MKNKILKQLSELTGHNHIKLTSRGNMAIFFATYFAKKLNSKTYFLIPDQGGWLTFKKYPKMFKFTQKDIQTNDGLIDLEKLKEFAPKSAAIIYSNPAGYFANQPIKEIYEICNKAECLVILDASGAIGTEWCDGQYADFIVGSFGKWKPVNAGFGGFISSKYTFPDKDIFSIYKECDSHNEIILKKLENVKERMLKLIKRADKVKTDLKDLKIIHPEKKGINVVIEYNTEKEKVQITNYCQNNDLEFTECPRYIRVEKEAISIEIKRLD